MKLHRRLSALIALCIIGSSLMLALITVPIASAACAVQFSVYDNPNYSLDPNEASPLVKCYGTNDANMDLDPFRNTNGQQVSGCGSSLVQHNTWDNCASSWKFVGSCHYGVVAYVDPSYGSILWSAWGNRNFSGGFGYEDSMTSFKFRYRSVCPSIAPAGETSPN